MSIAEMFESGIHKHNKGHFRNLLMLARADGNLSADEDEFLKEIGLKIGLNEAQIADIKADPMKYPTQPPVSKEERYVRFINFVVMIKKDDEISVKEMKLMRIFAVAIGFKSEDAEVKFKLINRLLNDEVSEDDILTQLMALRP